MSRSNRAAEAPIDGMLVRRRDPRNDLRAIYVDGWVILRDSGTELRRRVFAESWNPARAQAILDLGDFPVPRQPADRPPAARTSAPSA
ncbi:MAG: hypothetical protein L3K23_02390 [Thermoplasmata archaeon]|nr:hypothetical protein [Thermoplasmata archaeon]